MVFSSILFLFIYLPLALGIYYITPLKYRNLFLLFVNLIFYGWGEPVYILIMILSVLLNYGFGILIGHYRSKDRLTRFLVFASVFCNLAILIFFKYYDFIITNLALIPGFPTLQPLGLALPIGISFYTFQTMSYTIDVYRQDSVAQKNLVAFGTYVTMFPQLIAGPIVKYKDVASQLGHRQYSKEQFTSGILCFVCGFGKKVLLANNIGLLWDAYAAMPASELSVLGAWLGALAFTFQIYFDFSGYSDMAIGLGRMLGFEFKINFDYPYIAKSITEFWRRWHISLSSWFREYVYIPLGGNRVAPWKIYRNIFIVWLLTGIWHGASWNFLCWGLYFAILLCLEKAFLQKPLAKAPAFVGHLYAMVLVIFSWVIFAMTDMSQGMAYFKAMVGLGNIPFWDKTAFYYCRNYLPSFLVMAVAATPFGKKLWQKQPETGKRFLAPALTLLLLILATAYLVSASYNPFLYFRF